MKLPYFKLKEALDEARQSFSYGSNADKLASTARLLGKSVANVGMLATEIGVEAVKRAPEVYGQSAKRALNERSHLMSDEQKEKATQLVKMGEEARAKREKKEREEQARQEREEQRLR